MNKIISDMTSLAKTAVKAMLAFILLLSATAITKGQSQFHVTQYMVYQPIINPAAISSYRGLNGAIMYKKQWSGYTGAPETAGAFLNFSTPESNSFFGASVMKDQLGVEDNYQISGTYTYRAQLGADKYLGLGISPVLTLLQSRYSDLTLIEQNDAVFNKGSETVVLPNFRFGAYYFTGDFYAGFSSPNLLQNRVVFEGQKAKGDVGFNFSNIHYNLHAGYRWHLNEDWDLNTSFLSKYVWGSPMQMDFNGQVAFKSKYYLGASYRTSQELAAILGFALTPELLLSYSYEYNMSELGQHSDGTHEVVLTFTRPPLKEPVVNIPRF